MNKKGFLLGEEAIKIILAVVVIGFLIYFIAALYFGNLNQQKLEQAKATISESESGSLRAVIDRVRISGASENYLLTTPKGWNLFAFTSAKKPNLCVGENCLCICDEVSFDSIFGIVKDRQISECDDNGACLVVKDFAGGDLSLKIESTTIKISKFEGKIEVK